MKLSGPAHNTLPAMAESAVRPSERQPAPSTTPFPHAPPIAWADAGGARLYLSYGPVLFSHVQYGSFSAKT